MTPPPCFRNRLVTANLMKAQSIQVATLKRNRLTSVFNCYPQRFLFNHSSINVPLVDQPALMVRAAGELVHLPRVSKPGTKEPSITGEECGCFDSPLFSKYLLDVCRLCPK